MSKKVYNNIHFLIKGIELYDIALNHPPKILPQEITFHFDINVDHKINMKKKRLAVIIKINVYNESEKKILFGSVNSGYIFEINNLEDFYDPEKKLHDFPEDFLHTVHSISISTARGLMFSNFRGTYLHNAILPIIDPKSLVPNKQEKK